MSRRTLFKTAAVAGGAFALGQMPGGAAAQAATTLKFATGTDAVTMDPHQAVDIPSARAFMQVHETLVAAGQDGQVRGVLAESWTTSPDGLVWTFKLRKGISFSDGTPFNAEAVKYNYDRLADPAMASPRRVSATNGIASVNVVDDNTVEYRTKTPLAPLLLRLAHYNFAIMSPKAAQEAGKNYTRAPVGTGPFKMAKWAQDEMMTFVRNDGYWGTKPKLSTVEFRVVPEDNTRLLMLLSGDAHLIANVTPVMVPRLKGSPKVSVAQVPSTRVIYIGMNRNVAPFDKPQVREAVAAAIDSKVLVDQVLRGFGTQAGAFDPPFIPGSTTLPPYKYDPDHAKKLLAEAGLPNGFTADFYFTTGRYLNDKDVAQAIQAQLAKVGITLNMQSPEFGTFMGLIGSKKASMFMAGKGNPAFDLDGGLSLYVTTGGGMNYTNYADPEMDKLVAQQRTIIDPEERKALLKKILEKIRADAPELVLYYEQMIFAMQSNVKDVVVTPNEYVSFVNTTIN
ncbi:ABC transporter substrate-binding protein [Aquabacter sp. CN5-332]|uniref:ABC transporter substrate-binding protein n=1 Tax=Aquabacter sp. CN5-332 TaxID=3156608 RepID=UPI0032B5FACB